MRTALLALLFTISLSIQSESQCNFKNCQEINSLCQNEEFKAVCDLINTNDENEDPKQEVKSNPDKTAVWGYGILCVTIISFMSVIGVSFLPLMSKSFYNHLLTTLIGLAVGSLSGSALFHLIPSAFQLADIEFFKDHAYLEVSLVIWFGIYLFLLIERFLKIFMEHKKFQNPGGHSHTFENQPPKEIESEDEEKRMICAGSNIPSNEVYENSKAAMRASFGHMERPSAESRPTVETVRDLEKSTHGSKIATVAWMIIFGDGVHNFIDGLSIGAAFTESILTGISVSAAVLCEEFPHELGDFAVLLNSGMNIRQVLIFLSNFYHILSNAIYYRPWCTISCRLALATLVSSLEYFWEKCTWATNTFSPLQVECSSTLLLSIWFRNSIQLWIRCRNNPSNQLWLYFSYKM